MYKYIYIIHDTSTDRYRDLVAERRSVPELDIELWERATYPSGLALVLSPVYSEKLSGKTAEKRGENMVN